MPPFSKRFAWLALAVYVLIQVLATTLGLSLAWLLYVLVTKY